MKKAQLLVVLGSLIISFISMPILSSAQEQGMRRDPSQMVAAEKKLLFESLTTLNGDQKLIIEQIYKDYEQAFTNARSNAAPGNREVMRDTMMKIRDGKDESMKAILTEEQYNKFDAILKASRDGMRQRRGGRDQ